MTSRARARQARAPSTNTIFSRRATPCASRSSDSTWSATFIPPGCHAPIIPPRLLHCGASRGELPRGPPKAQNCSARRVRTSGKGWHAARGNARRSSWREARHEAGPLKGEADAPGTAPRQISQVKRTGAGPPGTRASAAPTAGKISRIARRGDQIRHHAAEDPAARPAPENSAQMVPSPARHTPVSYRRRPRRTPPGAARAALFDVTWAEVRLSPGRRRGGTNLVPVDDISASPGRQRYAFFTNSAGGIPDDPDDHPARDGWWSSTPPTVRDAVCRRIGHRCTVQPMPDRALLAGRQEGPQAAPGTALFMTGVPASPACPASPPAQATPAKTATRSRCRPRGRGVAKGAASAAEGETRLARRARRCASRPGPCLYGHDIDAKTTPVEAGPDLGDPEVRRAGGERHAATPAPRRSTRNLGRPGLQASASSASSARAGARRRHRRRRARATSSAMSPAARIGPTVGRKS